MTILSCAPNKALTPKKAIKAASMSEYPPIFTEALPCFPLHTISHSTLLLKKPSNFSFHQTQSEPAYPEKSPQSSVIFGQRQKSKVTAHSKAAVSRLAGDPRKSKLSENKNHLLTKKSKHDIISVKAVMRRSTHFSRSQRKDGRCKSWCGICGSSLGASHTNECQVVCGGLSPLRRSSALFFQRIQVVPRIFSALKPCIGFGAFFMLICR